MVEQPFGVRQIKSIGKGDPGLLRQIVEAYEAGDITFGERMQLKNISGRDDIEALLSGVDDLLSK